MNLLDQARTCYNYIYSVALTAWVPDEGGGGGTGGAGDASAANQVTGNASLASIDAKTPALSGGSSPVVLPTAQITALTPPAAITGFATEAGNLATLVARTPALGQALAAAASPVVLTAAQLTTLTPIAGGLTEADFDTKTGSLTETVPTTDTASSGLNGRLQRIAQRLSSLITALGSPFQAGGSIGNTAFGHASSATVAITRVASSATSVQLLASTPTRRLATIYNDSSAVLYLKYGTTASATSKNLPIPAGGYFEFPHPIYTGRVDGIWANANGAADIVEET